MGWTRPPVRLRDTPLLLALLTLTLGNSRAFAARAVEHRGVVFVSLPDLLDEDFLNGTWALTDSGRTIDVSVRDRSVRFAEGGDRIVPALGNETMLRSPVLVLDGTHYVPADECASLLGYTYDPKPSPTLVYEDRRLTLEIEPLDLPHLNMRVDALRPVRRAIVLTAKLSVRPNLHDGTPAKELPAGTGLLVRREVRLNGVPHGIITRSDESLDSYAVALDALNGASRETSLEPTHLGRVLKRLSDFASHSSAINHGPRTDLPRTVSMTVDLCWSLRPYERDFFRFVPRVAKVNGDAWVTLFVTGRWLEQHPDEMERLIELSREPGVGVTWALHSWVHPKQRPFMNAYSPQDVREDNQRVEAELLRWGIVPSIFYRFPGLIHDEPRLRAILDLDLISVDCDSWVASMRRGRSPHHLWPGDGSIVLIHGNGNEAIGIPRLYEWMIENPGWKWGRLNRFISADAEADTGTTQPATQPTTVPQFERRRGQRAPATNR
ncbi:MAG: polysaccharide deacetylase family protein [Planctomycetota bacterium]|nr:polysaccharide deacetylase family protein [Planctomycetota bacterium]